MVIVTFKEELETILEKEVTTLMSLKDISFEKTDIIINNHIQELEQMAKKEESLINEIGLLEKERERLFDTWGLAIGTPISDVIEKIPEDNKMLIVIKDKMRDIFEELQLRNKLNNDLIKENLDWIDFNMNLITGMQTPQNYGKDNKKSSTNSIFDRKV